MSVNICLNIGPFMRVPKEKSVEVEIVRKCSNASCKCKKNLQTNYCPDCGNKTESIRKEKPIFVSAFHDYMDEELYDLFEMPHAGGVEISSKIDFYIAQADNAEEEEKLGIISVDSSDSCGYEMSGIDIPAAIAFFKEKYSAQIEFLRCKNIEPEIVYGLFVHYS